MLLFTSATRVEWRTTLGDFVSSQLGLGQAIGGVIPDCNAVDALLDEIWNADINAHLRRDSPEGSRQHVPCGESSSRTLELLPDEWVYLPLREVQSPGWELRTLEVAADSADAAAEDVAQWATEHLYTLPPQKGATSSSAQQTIDAETLEEYVYNSLLRSGGKTDLVYFYAAPPTVVPVDAPPSTPAGGATRTNGQPTPDWLLGLWHYIDRLRAAADTHAKQYVALHELIADGKFVAGTIDVVDRLMFAMERELMPGPAPTHWYEQVAEDLGNMMSPDGGLKLDIAEVHSKMRPLRDQAMRELVENPTYPEVSLFHSSLKRLNDIAEEPAFAQLYDEFDLERQKYPMTEQALELAMSDCVEALVLDPDCDALVDSWLDAFLNGAQGSSPFTREIAKVFEGHTVKQFTDDATSIAGLTVGNAPGPSTLWVRLTKIAFLRELRKVQVAPKGYRRGNPMVLREYLARLVRASGVPKSILQQWENEQPASRTPSVRARATAARVAAAEEITARTQSGPRFLAALGVLNLWAIYSAAVSTDSDIDAVRQATDGKAKFSAWLGLGADAAGGGAAGANLTADVAALLLKTDTVATSLKAGQLFGKAVQATAAWAGEAAAVFGAVFGCVQVVRGIHDDDWKKWLQGAGSLAISGGYWLDVFVTRRGALLVVEEGLGEVGALTLGEAALLGLGSWLTVIGILATIVVIAATNSSLLMQLAYEAFTPGTQKFVDTFFTQLEACKAVQLGPGSFRSAIADAKSASSRAKYVVWFVRDSVCVELKALGLNEADIRLLKSVPYTPGMGAMRP